MLDVPYRGKQYLLKAEVEFMDEDMIESRVHCLRSSLLVATEFKRPQVDKFSWKFLEGSMRTVGPDAVSLQLDIFSCLDYLIANEDWKK